MPVITFIKDVTLPNEPEGTGPHYRRGYSPEVSEDEARKWVKAGAAVIGIVQLQKPKPEKTSEAPRTRKSRRWGE